MFRLKFVADTIVASNGGSNHRNGLGKLHNWMGRGLLPVELYLLQLCVEAKRFCTICSLAEGFVVVSFVGRILLFCCGYPSLERNRGFFWMKMTFFLGKIGCRTHIIII